MKNKYLIFTFLLAGIVLATPWTVKADCNFDESQSNFQESVPGVLNVPNSGMPSYEYNNRYYATPSAASSLAQCLGGTVTAISSGFAPGSPFVKPDALGVRLPNGQVINAGDAVYMYFGLDAGSASNAYGRWQNYINLPDAPSGNSNSAVGGYYTGPTSNGGGVATVVTQGGVNAGAGTGRTTTSLSPTTSTTIQQKISDMVSGMIGSYNNQYQTFVSQQANPTQTSTPSSTPRLNSDLRIGSSGPDVTLLTRVLVKEGLLNAESSTFDKSVFEAVVKYQEKYASSILTPNGLSSGTGFVGPSTRAHMNSRMSEENVDNVVASVPPPVCSNFVVSARYIKVSSASRSWVAWKEIEIYDEQGGKITPVSVTSSSSAGPQNAPQFAIDGNLSTSWNAGETAPGCSRNQFLCGIGGETGSITIDLGTQKQILKIRLVTSNTPNPSSATHQISVSNDKTNFVPFRTFSGNMLNNTILDGVCGQITPKNYSLYDYTFSKSGSSWTVTTNNPAYGNQSEASYVPANYSITADSDSDLYSKLSLRFTDQYYLPKDVEGDTLYARMFTSFMDAHDNWDDKIFAVVNGGEATSTTYSYKFTRNPYGGWIVTLNSPAYGSREKTYYIGENYAATAMSLPEFNYYIQDRSTSAIYIPPEAGGKIIYNNIFNSLKKAAEEWNTATGQGQ